ncbi:GTP-binding protein 10 homolog [Brevipalpus obovatus]|uniref:GTP-binding protein 10 homolog n=1 Tax=Brevipalpus obovatus TaxID=246614 RepID=UPI003D9DFEE3
MVNLTLCKLCQTASALTLNNLQRSVKSVSEQNFRYSIKLMLTAGRGGNGYDRINGIGGNGGDIVIMSSWKVNSLLRLERRFRNRIVEAPSGKDSSILHVVVPPADNKIIKVPPGVDIHDAKDRFLIGTLEKDLDRIVVVKGGEGGCLKNQFIGQPGETREIQLTLKLIGDFGFVGFPNAGKSTLLRVISRATPKVADYAFTTLNPNIGVVEYPNSSIKIKCTDLPGLVEGAHQNVGLGHEFLRHIERTKFLLFIIDASGFQYSPDKPYRTALETLLLLNREVELYASHLIDKPCYIVVTKLDTKDAKLKYKEFLIALRDLLGSGVESLPPELRPIRFILFQDIVPISSHSGLNIAYLKQRLKDLLRDSQYRYEKIIERQNSLIGIVDSKLSMIVDNKS